MRRSFAGCLAALLPLLVLASCDGGWRERGEAQLAEADLIEELTAIGYVAGAEPAGPRSGVSLHDIDRVQPGLNLFTSGHGPVAVLMDMDGVVLNEWRVGFAELFPDHPHARPGAEPRRSFWRVARLLAGGDLIAIWELYGYPAPGSYPNGGPSMRETLAQPVGGELFFAGEATNNTAPSTVPGALQSGERASGEIDVALGGPPAPGAPKADLQALPTSGAPPLQVSFIDMSSNGPTSWSWDFGDSETSADQHPVHEYAAGGIYTVSLTATNGAGSHTRVLPALIAVPEPGQIVLLAAGLLGLGALNALRRARQASDSTPTN